MLTYPEKMEIIRRHQLAPPVQTIPIADDLGLRVWHVPNWPNDLSGKIVRSQEHGGTSGYAIYVNGSHHKNRRRFTTAHEIAHFVLHQDFIGDGIVDDGLYRSILSNSMEAEANRLAADILMPRFLLDGYVSQAGMSVAKLAQIFEVSEAAMSIRVGAPA